MAHALLTGKRFIYPIRNKVRSKILWDESGHEPQLRAVHADGATAKSAQMGGEARPSGSGVGLMHRLRLRFVNEGEFNTIGLGSGLWLGSGLGSGFFGRGVFEKFFLAVRGMTENHKLFRFDMVLVNHVTYQLDGSAGRQFPMVGIESSQKGAFIYMARHQKLLTKRFQNRGQFI